jgi:dCTP deaminase
VKPFAFDTLLYDGLPLNQIRFFASDTRIRSKKGVLTMEESQGAILFKPDGTPIPLGGVADHDGSVPLAIDLESEIVGYEAIATHRVLDMSATGLNWRDFWRAIPKPKDGRLYIEKDHFYILSNIEPARVPVTHSCEMRPTDDRIGNFRSHFAGYIDDGWGGKDGATLTLEVQPFASMYLRPGQIVARLVYEAMAEPAEKPYTLKTSSYVGQIGPKLGKQFA